MSVGTVELLAGQTYYVFSTEPSYDWYGQFDSYYGPTCTETTVSGVTINNAISVTMPSGEWYPAQWTFTAGTAGNVAGPVDFRYITTAGSGPVAYPPATTNGNQAAYIQGTGSISQTLTFPAGVCDVTFYAAQGASGSESFTVYIDGTALAWNWNTAFTPSDPYYDFYRTGSGLNLTAGTHTLSFVGTGSGTVFIDDVQVESADAMLNSGPETIGPTAVSEVDWDLAYGLKTVGYEGGFEVGGDSPTAASMAANVDLRVQQDTAATLDEYLSSGGTLPIVFNAAGGAYAVAMTSPYGSPNVYDQSTPKMAAYQAAEAALPVPVSNATTVPATLTPSNLTLFLSDSDGKTYADTAGDIDLNSGWINWNVIIPSSGTYTLAATTTGSGSSYVILADEVTVALVASNGTVSGSIALSPGLHSIKIRSTANTAFQVTSIVVSENGAPLSPTISSASLSGSTATLAWSAASGAAGYIVAYGSAAGQYTTFTDVGNVTTTTVSGLNPTLVDHFAVYAYNASLARSLPSADVRLAPRSTDPSVYANFADQPVSDNETTTPVTEPLVEGNIAFTSYGNNAGKGLIIADSGNGYYALPSKGMLGYSWGTSQRITSSDGHAFDLYSLDLTEFQACSAVITGFDSSGGTLTQIVNFGSPAPSIAISHQVLDWTDLTKVQVTWWDTLNGIGGGRNGAIDNLVFNDLPPTISSASATPATVTGRSDGPLRDGRAYDPAVNPASALIYTWAASTLPAGAAAPTFTNNNSNAAQNTTARFSAAGIYVFTVTVTDGCNLVATQTVSVTVTQTASGITITPASPTVADSGTQQLTAVVGDQFGAAMGTQPSFTWSITGGSGTLSTSGLFTAPASGSGWSYVQAVGGGYTGTGAVYYTSTAVPNYPNGFSSGSLTFAGNGALTDSHLRLTSSGYTAGAAWYNAKLSTSSFVTDFAFQISSQAGQYDCGMGGNGITFTIQNMANNALGAFKTGTTYTGLGYQNITSSVALKFDLAPWDNNWNSTVGAGNEELDSIGVFTDGAAPPRRPATCR